MRFTTILIACAAGSALGMTAASRAAGQTMKLSSNVRAIGAPNEAVGDRPLARLARLSVDDIPTAAALTALQSRSGVPLIFSPSLLDARRKVSCDCVDLKVSDALDVLLSGTGLVYSEFNESVLIEPEVAKPKEPAAQQARVITGRVVDSVSKDPVQSGQVQVVGTRLGALIKSDGSFSVSVPPRTVALSIRSIGYVPRTITVPPGQDSLRVGLARDYFQLEAVVVTGQATGVEKKNLANSVATVDALQLADVPAPTIENALQGKVAGAHISENSGAPGGGNIVRMRGVTSINGAFTPLYVVDGVIVSDVNLGTGTNAIIRANGSTLDPQTGNEDNGDNRIADLNSYDIESVEVLKGASASAIYGSKAANGVIVITTKKGQTGAPQWDVNQRFGFSELEHEFGHRCFTQQEAITTFGPTAANNWTPACYDFEHELYGGHPTANETSVSARGGVETTHYFISALDSYDGGIVPNTNAGKQSLRVNLDQNIGTRLTLSIGAEGIHTLRNPGVTQNGNNGTPIGGNIAYGGATWLPLNQPVNGVYPVNPYAAGNPFQTVRLFQNNESVWRSILSERVNLDMYHSARQTLNFISSGGLDIFTQKNAVLAPPELYPQQFAALPGASELSYGQNQNTNLNANLVHTLNLGGATTATSQIGIEYETQDLDASHTLASGLVGGLSNIDEGLAVAVQENRLRVRDMGLFAQEEYLTLNQRLLLTLGGRADQSSNNGNANQLYFYPKGSVSYRIPGLPKFMDDLKLRAAYGFSGNEPLYGQKFTELTPGNIAGTIPILAIQGNTGASNLQPERQREIETGVDITMLKNRLSVEITGYEKLVSNLLLQQTLAPSTGFSSLFFNGGSMRNRGAEITASAVPVQSTGLTWRTTGTYTMTRCQVVSLPVAAFRPAATLNSASFGYTFIQPGASCTQIYGRDTLGSRPSDSNLGAPGTAIQRALVDDNPNFNISWSNNLDYRRVHLSFLADAQKGGILSNITEYEYDATGTSPDYLVPRSAGAMTGQQRITAFSKVTSPYLQDVSYLKLREVTLGLDVPQRFVQGVWNGFRTARLSLSGRNLLVFTPYHSTADPEANQIARSAAQGVPWDVWAYPPSRQFFLTVNFGM